MADGNFYEDVDASGNGFIIPSVTNTYQLPVERDTLLRLIRISGVPLKNKKKFKQFCCQLVNVPLDDEVVQRAWNFLKKNRCEDKDGIGWSESSQKFSEMHANTNQRESLSSGKQSMELTSSVIEHMMEKDSNRESGVHCVDQKYLNAEAASKDDTSHEIISEKSETSNGLGNCMQYLSVKSEPLSEEYISHVDISVKSEPILDLVPCAVVEPISYEFDKFYCDSSESKFVCHDRSISNSVTDFNPYPVEQHNLNSVYQNDHLAEKTSPDVADPFITFKFVLDSTETNSSVSPLESTSFAAKPGGNVIENILQTDCHIENSNELMDSNLSSKTSYHEDDQLIEVNGKEILPMSEENGLGKKDRKKEKDRIVNQTVIGETLAKRKKSIRQVDKNQTSDSSEVRKRSPSEEISQSNKTKKHKVENNKEDSSKEFESSSSVVLEVSSKGRKKKTKHKSLGENSCNGLLNRKTRNSKKHSMVNNEHNCSPERPLRPEGHKSSNLEKLKGKLLSNVLRKKKKQVKKLKMREELEILRNVMEVLVDQISQLPETHKTLISNALIKKSSSLGKSKHIYCIEHTSEESNNKTDESIRKPRKKNKDNEFVNNSRTLSPRETENEDTIKLGKKHQIKINCHQMSSNTAEYNDSTESCVQESNYSGIQSNAAKMKTSKKIKKHKKAHCVDTCLSDHVDISYETEEQTGDNQTQVIQKKLRSNRQRPSKLSASICDISGDSSKGKVSKSGPESLDYSSGIESDCSVKRGRFLWKEMIMEILRAHVPHGLPYHRLQKKVIKKYSKERGRISSNTVGKFERYLSKIPGVIIHRNTVMLSEPASEKNLQLSAPIILDRKFSLWTEVTEKKKQRNIVVQKIVKTTKYLLSQ